MNVWIDICHTPQYNFYRHFIEKLSEQGHSVYITVLKRGEMPLIIQNEIGDLNNVHIDIVGTHRFNKFSAIVDANLFRIFRLLKWSWNKHIDVAFSNSFLVGIVCTLKGVISYAFGDDLRKMDYKLKSVFNRRSFYCIYSLPESLKNIYNKKNSEILPVLKEWSYLAPSVFKANIKALDEYNLTPKDYIFLREVSVGTVNYTGQASGAILNIKESLPTDKKIIFSLEDKSKRDMYPSDWILLQEPVKDIHSLIYYSAALVSSGDSMAREAALLGVPSYYLGIRHSMPANIAASKVAGLKNEVSMPFEKWIDTFESKATEELIEKQQETIKNIDNTFTDINEYIWGLLNK